MSLHARLHALWMSFQHVSYLEARHSQLWWTQVLTCFDSLTSANVFGGNPTFQLQRGKPMDRILNKVVHKKEWALPWMKVFVQRVSCSALEDPELMAKQAFAMFFNAAYDLLMNDDGSESEWETDSIPYDPTSPSEQ
jgi:hypothetical protein